MVTVNGVKYACDRCIRGHRVSGCRHIGDPLKLVKRKGRPSRGNILCGNCPKSKGKAALDATGCDCADNGEPNAQDNFDESNFEPQQNLTPCEIQTLRGKMSVQIKLPDGTILGPVADDPVIEEAELFTRENSTPPCHYHSIEEEDTLKLSDKNIYLDENRTPETYQTKNFIDFGEDELLASNEIDFHNNEEYAPEEAYSTAIYDRSGGNNETMIMNALGTGGYAPNTGSVQSNPNMIMDHELTISIQSLAKSLSGLQDSSDRPINERDEIESYLSSTPMSNLSNLY